MVYWDRSRNGRGKGGGGIPTFLLVLLSAADILCYTLRGYTNKCFAISYSGTAMNANAVFSCISGLSGFLLTILFFGGIALPSATTLAMGLLAGLVLYLYNEANIRAAQTGPYAFQSIINLFGCVTLPLLFGRFLWGVTLSPLQYGGVFCVLCSFVVLNLKGSRPTETRKGYYVWVALLFLTNGIYSTVMDAQQRLMRQAEHQEMVAIVFLTLGVASLVSLLARRKATGFPAAFRMNRASWLYSLASSAALTVAMNLLMLLLGYIDASVLYPIQNCAVLILVVLLSAIRLHERIRPATIVGIGIALLGIAALSI